MRGLWAILLPIFALGFGLAWWLKPDPAPVETEADRPKVVPRAPGRDPGLQEHVIDAGTLLDALGDLRYRDDEFSEQLGAINLSEIPGLLDSLAGRAGYFGLDHEDEEVLKKLVARWYDLDGDAALLWVLALEPEGDRERLLRGLVDHVAEQDLDAAIALARKCVPENGAAPDLPLSLQQKAVDAGQEKLLELCRLSIGKSDGTSGLDLNYPPDFDFAGTLNGLVELLDSLKEGEKLTSIPSNLLEEWTRRDPQAAFEWVSKGHELSFNEMEDFIEAYAEVGGADEVGALVGEIFKGDDSRDFERYGLVWEALSEAPRAETLEGFLAAAGESGTRDVLLSGLLDRSGSGVGGSYTHGRRVIIEGMTPEQRMAALPASNLTDDMRQELIPDLRRLGHTEAEIAAMTKVGND